MPTISEMMPTDVKESLFHIFDIKLGADALASLPNIGELDVPVSVDGKIGFDHGVGSKMIW